MLAQAPTTGNPTEGWQDLIRMALKAEMVEMAAVATEFEWPPSLISGVGQLFDRPLVLLSNTRVL